MLSLLLALLPQGQPVIATPSSWHCYMRYFGPQSVHPVVNQSTVPNPASGSYRLQDSASQTVAESFVVPTTTVDAHGRQIVDIALVVNLQNVPSSDMVDIFVDVNYIVDFTNLGGALSIETWDDHPAWLGKWTVTTPEQLQWSSDNPFRNTDHTELPIQEPNIPLSRSVLVSLYFAMDHVYGGEIYSTTVRLTNHLMTEPIQELRGLPDEVGAIDMLRWDRPAPGVISLLSSTPAFALLSLSERPTYLDLGSYAHNYLWVDSPSIIPMGSCVFSLQDSVLQMLPPVYVQSIAVTPGGLLTGNVIRLGT